MNRRNFSDNLLVSLKQEQEEPQPEEKPKKVWYSPRQCPNSWVATLPSETEVSIVPHSYDRITAP